MEPRQYLYYHPNIISDTCPNTPLFAGDGGFCGCVLVGSVGVLRVLGMPARLKAAPGGASLIGVPKAGGFENPPGDGELMVAGNPSSIDMGIAVST
jgi:hypothetical protein